MNINIQELIKTCRADKHAIETDIENIISEHLSFRLRSDILAVFGKKGNLFIYKFGISNIEQIEPENIHKGLAKEIRRRIKKSLIERNAFSQYDYLVTNIGKIVPGKLIKRVDLDWYVELVLFGENGPMNFVGVCKYMSQTKKERHLVPLGDKRNYFIESISPVYPNEVPRLDIRLSRRSKTLTETLLKDLMQKQGLYFKTKCIRRVAGAFSEVVSERKIPRNIIKDVSNELKEKIKVRFVANTQTQKIKLRHFSI